MQWHGMKCVLCFWTAYHINSLVTIRKQEEENTRRSICLIPTASMEMTGRQSHRPKSVDSWLCFGFQKSSLATFCSFLSSIDSPAGDAQAAITATFCSVHQKWNIMRLERGLQLGAFIQKFNKACMAHRRES